MNDEPTILELSIRSHRNELPGVRNQVRRLACEQGFDDEAVARIALAMDEALANVIKHGYDGAGGQPIDISFLRTARGDRRGIKIVVEDYGKQVDPKTIRSRDLAQVRPGGLGVHIMNAVMDEVQYDRASDRGMRLTMIKWLPEAGPQAASP